MSEFIFMLTRDDMTVPDAVEVYEQIRDLDMRWVGFKDVGVPVEVLQELTKRIRADNRKVALEVVSLDVESELRSAKVAIDLDVDLLMGGTNPTEVLPLLRSSNALYFPFVGAIESHPSILVGSAREIADHAQLLSGMRGVHGLDLLAYRFSGDVPALISSVARASGVPVVVAGSIRSAEQIKAVEEAGAWAFTVGGAVFDNSFPAEHSLRSQIEYILSVLDRAPSPTD